MDKRQILTGFPTRGSIGHVGKNSLYIPKVLPGMDESLHIFT